MSEEKRSCENCGNSRCANNAVAFFYDECVESKYTKHWKPKQECPFCEAVKLQKFFNERHSKPEGIENVLAVALVSHSVINGQKRGRSTDYMKDGEGFPLNFCPVCGKRVED